MQSSRWLPACPGRAQACDLQPGAARGKRHQALKGMKKCPVTGQWFRRVIRPIQLQVQQRHQGGGARPKHRAERKIEKFIERQRYPHALREVLCDCPVLIPTYHMRIFCHQQADLQFRGKDASGEIKHPEAIADEIVPEKLAPQIAHGSVHAQALLAMKMAKHVIATFNDFSAEAGQERTDVTTQIWHDTDIDRTMMAVENRA